MTNWGNGVGDMNAEEGNRSLKSILSWAVPSDVYETIQDNECISCPCIFTLII